MLCAGSPTEELWEPDVPRAEWAAGWAESAAVWHAHPERPARVLQPHTLRQQAHARCVCRMQSSLFIDKHPPNHNEQALIKIHNCLYAWSRRNLCWCMARALLCHKCYITRSRFYKSAQAMLTYRSTPITLTLLGASQVTVGKLAYRRLRRFIKPARVKTCWVGITVILTRDIVD